jgi:hypothetical protein
MYSRYADAQYVGYSDASVYVIDALDKTFLRMGEPIEIQADDKCNNSIFRHFLKREELSPISGNHMRILKISLSRDL